MSFNGYKLWSVLERKGKKKMLALKHSWSLCVWGWGGFVSLTGIQYASLHYKRIDKEPECRISHLKQSYIPPAQTNGVEEIIQKAFTHLMSNVFKTTRYI